MNHRITKLISVFTIAIVTMVASQAKADIYDHIDLYALKIQLKTRMLLNETVHYRHTPEYGKLVACTNQLSKTAKHIHDVSHFEGNLIHLREDLQILDQEFHALEGLFDQIERRASYGRRHILGNTAHVKELLDCIENSIHNIQDDVDELLEATACPNSVSRPAYTPTITRSIYVPRPVYTPTVTRTVTQSVYVPAVARPVYVPTRPVVVPTRPSLNIQFSKNSVGRGIGPDDRGPGCDRGRGRDRHDLARGHDFDRGRGYDYDRGRSNRNRSNGPGFSIGGGSSKIQIRF